MINDLKTRALKFLKMLHNILTTWWVWCILSIIFFVIDFLFGKGTNFLIFNNTKGKFDFGIMWTAIGSIVTALISVVSVWQTKQATFISEMSLKNEIIRNSCVIDFDDSNDPNDPCVSIKDFINNQGKGLYIKFKNYGNIDIGDYEAIVSFLDASLQPLLASKSPIKGAFLRHGGTNSLTVKMPPVSNNMLQMRIDFQFIPISGIKKNESLTSQFVIGQGDSLDMREKYINFYEEDKKDKKEKH